MDDVGGAQRMVARREHQSRRDGEPQHAEPGRGFRVETALEIVRDKADRIALDKRTLIGVAIEQHARMSSGSSWQAAIQSRVG